MVLLLSEIKRILRYISNRIRSIVNKYYIKKTSTRISLSQLISDLKDFGIKNGDTLMIHSSLSKIGYVKNGPKTLLRAILNVIGEEGTLVIPTYTMDSTMYKTCINKKYSFNLKKPTNLGAVPSEILKMKGIYRSIHPTHSVSAIGKHAKCITEEHHIGRKSFGEHSPWAKILELNGKFLGIGISLSPNAQYHYVEDIMDEEFPIKVKLDKIYKLKCKINKKKIIYVNVQPLDPIVAKTRIDKKESYFIRNIFWEIFKNLDILHLAKIGEAESWWVDAKTFSKVLIKLAKLDITIYSTEAHLKAKNLYPIEAILEKLKHT